MIFAAGFGTRLQPLTKEIPKALVEVKGYPLLFWAIQYLTRAGFKEIIINTHYLHTKIDDYISANHFNAEIHLSYEPVILGTGSGFYNTKEFWDQSDFIIFNTDILCNTNLIDFFNYHRSNQHLGTLAINHRESNSMLLVDQASKLVGIKRKGIESILTPPKGKVIPVGFCGFQALSPRIFDYMQVPVQFSIVDMYLELVKGGLPIYTWDIGSAYWEDLGTHSALRSAQEDFPSVI